MLESGYMNDTNCLFCKIVAGELPCEKVYEDEKTLAFLDIKPVNPGHTLVVPKEHYANVFDAPEDAWCKVMQTARTIAHAISQGLPVGDVNIITNNGRHSGQVVFHSHVHVIPRHENDGHGTWLGTPYEEGQAKMIAEKIISAL
jgi:histidine triad (HIT) family protein